MTDTLLQNKFNAEILEAIEGMKKAKYNPTRFIRMLHQEKDNAFKVVQKLVTKEVSSGLTELWNHNILNLSVEAIIIKPEYQTLFSPETISICKKKLKRLGYKF